MPYILIKRKVDGPSVPELGTPTAVTFDSVTVPLARPSTGPNAIASYVIERATSAAGPWVIAAEGPAIFGNPPTQFVDGGRLALTEYFYRARATDTAGRVSAYCAVVSATTAATVLPSTVPEFPRVACVHYGVRVYGTAAGQAGMAQFDMVVLNGWEIFHLAFNQQQLAQICANVKALNPAIQLYFYLNPPAVRLPLSDRPALAAKVAAENWWMRTAYPSGSIVVDKTYPDQTVNITRANTRTDAAGLRPIEWIMGDYAKGMYVDGSLGGVAANPYWDGFFFDNALVRARFNGDYDENGTLESEQDVGYALSWRQGLALGAARYRQLMPSKKIIGNSDFASIRYEGRGGTTWPDATLDQVYDGVMTEGLFGLSYSPEVWGLPTSAAQWAQDQEDMSRDPTIGFTHAQRLRTLSSTNYQDARHSICAQLILSNQMICYVDDGPDRFTSSTGFDGCARWFDEYDGGGRGKRYLGRASDLRQKAAFDSHGVWRRRFQFGDVYWNPRNNGVREVTLPSAMRKIQGRSGFSDTSVNNGQLVTKITLQDRDGVVLLRP